MVGFRAYQGPTLKRPGDWRARGGEGEKGRFRLQDTSRPRVDPVVKKRRGDESIMPWTGTKNSRIGINTPAKRNRGGIEEFPKGYRGGNIGARLVPG